MRDVHRIRFARTAVAPFLVAATLCAVTPLLAASKSPDVETQGPPVPLEAAQRAALAEKDALRAGKPAQAPPAVRTKEHAPTAGTIAPAGEAELPSRARVVAAKSPWSQVSSRLGPIPRPAWTAPPGERKPADRTISRPVPAATGGAERRP